MADPTQTGQGDGASHREDLDMVKGALEGDQQALEQFMQRIQSVRRFLAYKNAQFGSPLGGADLEDTVQETLLAIWRKLPGYQGRGSFETWVYRFCFLELVTRIRKLDRTRALFERPPQGESEAWSSPERPDPLELEHVYRGLEALEPGVGALIRDKHIEQLTFEEIAARTGLPVNTVKTRYYRGLRKLRELLALGDNETEGGQ